MGNPLRILFRVRGRYGRRGWRDRDVRRLMELARVMWLHYVRRYRLRWEEGVIREGS